MKVLALTLLALVIIGSIPESNEKKSSGKIVYKIILPENEVNEVYPERIIFSFKEKRYRCDFDFGSNKKNENFSIINDTIPEKNLVLSELNGKKYCILGTKSQTIQPVTWKTTDEKEKICGMKCIKYQGLYANQNRDPTKEITVYYSDEIDSPDWCLNKPGRGILMKFELFVNGNKIIFEATNIDKNNQLDHVFVPPATYRVITEKEWVKLLTNEIN